MDLSGLGWERCRTLERGPVDSVGWAKWRPSVLTHTPGHWIPCFLLASPSDSDEEEWLRRLETGEVDERGQLLRHSSARLTSRQVMGLVERPWR